MMLMRMFREDALKNTITIKELRDYLNILVESGDGDCKIIRVLDPKNINPYKNGPKRNFENIWPIAPLYQDLNTEEKPYVI